MITRKDRTFDNMLVLVCAVANSKRLGSLRTGPRELLGVGQKPILDLYFVSDMVFLKRSLFTYEMLGHEWSKDPVTCLYVCIGVCV